MASCINAVEAAVTLEPYSVTAWRPQDANCILAEYFTRFYKSLFYVPTLNLCCLGGLFSLFLPCLFYIIKINSTFFST